MAKKNQSLREAKVVDVPEDFENNSDIEGIGDDSMLMPNEGELMNPEVQEDVQQEINEDQAMFVGNDALVDAIFEWLDNEIKDTDSVELTVAMAKVYKISIENAMIAMDTLKKALEEKKVTFQNIRDTLNT